MDIQDVTVSTIFGSMNDRFKADKAAGVDIKIGYNITGSGGGKWTVKIKDQNCFVIADLEPECAATIQMADKDFIGLNTGTIDPVSLFTAGKVTIVGDMMSAGVTAKLFEPIRVAKAEAEELVCLRVTPSINQRFPTGPYMGRFFEGLKEKKFIANKCPKCGRVQMPPREVCANCRVRCDEFVEVGPKMYMLLLDICYFASPDPLTGETRETPYGVVVVFPEGKEPVEKRESFVHLLKRSDIGKAAFGTRLRPVWAEKTTGSFNDLLYFEIDDEGGA